MQINSNVVVQHAQQMSCPISATATSCSVFFFFVSLKLIRQNWFLWQEITRFRRWRCQTYTADNWYFIILSTDFSNTDKTKDGSASTADPDRYRRRSATAIILSCGISFLRKCKSWLILVLLINTELNAQWIHLCFTYCQTTCSV